MSLWYDLKQKAYSTDKNNSWLKAYADRIVSLLKGEINATLTSHFSGETNRHLAKDIDTENGNTVEQAFEIERITRQTADEANQKKLAQETSDRIAGDNNLSERISNETSERLSADSSLTSSLLAETAAREAADTEINIKVAQLLSASPINVPTLAEVCADGTAIGSDAWTGTGFFCISDGKKYVAKSAVTSVLGFNRFCLRPTDTFPYWRSWTPYFDYEGQAYEFFYSPVRGVYETLIPPITMTGEEIVATLRWEYHAPTLLNYGKISNLFKYYMTEDSDVLMSVMSEFYFRNSSGGINALDYEMFTGFIYDFYTLAENSITITDLDWVRGTIYTLTLDLSGVGQPKNSSNLIQINDAYKQLTANLKIETCDNF